MKYVTKIVDSDGKSYKGVRYGLVDTDRFKITTTDFDTGRMHVGHEVKQCVGCGREYGSASVACAVHTEEAARFTKYVTYLGSDGFIQGVFDVINKHGLVKKLDGADGLNMKISDDTLIFAGEQGSVVTYMNPRSGQVAILPLYDLLRRLCQIYNLNIMGYKYLQFTSDVRPYKHMFEFIHNKESDRFFLKTFLLSGRE